jgi:hypothetical protein
LEINQSIFNFAISVLVESTVAIFESWGDLLLQQVAGLRALAASEVRFSEPCLLATSGILTPWMKTPQSYIR